MLLVPIDEKSLRKKLPIWYSLLWWAILINWPNSTPCGWGLTPCVGSFGNSGLALSNKNIFLSGLVNIILACGLTIAVDLIYSNTEGRASLYLPFIANSTLVPWYFSG